MKTKLKKLQKRVSEAERLLSAEIMDVQWVKDRDLWLGKTKHFFLNGKRFEAPDPICGVVVRSKLPAECAAYIITVEGTYPNPQCLDDGDYVADGSRFEMTPPSGFTGGVK